MIKSELVQRIAEQNPHLFAKDVQSINDQQAHGWIPLLASSRAAPINGTYFMTAFYASRVASYGGHTVRPVSITQTRPSAGEEVLGARGAQLGIASRVRNVLVAKIRLDRAGVAAGVGFVDENFWIEHAFGWYA
jgi:hypothetical protein